MMGSLQPTVQDRRPSPHLTLELSSNNPFRNRAASPAVASPSLDTPGSTHSLPNGRPVSRNPFLANFEQDTTPAAVNHTKSPFFDEMSSTQKASPNTADFGSHVDELFRNMALNGKNEPRRDSSSNARQPPPRAGTMPRPSRPQESDSRRDNRPPRSRGNPNERRLVDSPERRENRKPRRNSESSIADKPSLAEEDRRRRERRRERERERGGERSERSDRTKDGKTREGRSSKPKKPHGLDVIDKLDLTGLYGSGLFHHDGPFDACNPHRNRRKDHRAPMQAFPVDSTNNTLGGAGPVNDKIDLDRIHGRVPEGFTDYNKTNVGQDPFTFRAKQPQEKRSGHFNPKGFDFVHGDESAGLGTSTFLEGAPASRSALQRRDSENEAAALQGGGLSRKKSLAQRIRGISQPRRDFGDGGPRIGSGDPRYVPTSPEEMPGTRNVQSAGGMAKANEQNPFFEDYNDAYEKKGSTIKIAEEAKGTRVGGPGSPKRNGVERRLTSGSGEEREQKTNGGFLNRMKSLKGGKRPRPERPMA